MDNSFDIEAGETPASYVEGYHDFSEFIATDAKLSIYRRYDSLAARNLLYLEAELQLLECQLAEYDEEDLEILREGSNEEKSDIEAASRNWENLLEQANQNDSRAAERLVLIRKLRLMMKDYEKALLRRSQIMALGSPDEQSFTAFKNWFRKRAPLRGSGWHLLHKENDMLSLHIQPESDRLTSLIQRYFGYYARKDKTIPVTWGENLFYYPPERIAWIVAAISIFLSAVLLIGAIIVLYFVRPMPKRLGIIAAFTCVFAASLGLLTNARRAEIFGSTAAYAAVLVVFVSVDA